MSFGCCNKFKECSDAGCCISIEFENEEGGCLYKENLDKGLNFYTEYNENNQLRADEYNQRQNNKETKDKFNQIAIEYKGTFIEIPNRFFYIGRRGSYRGWTFSLDKDESKQLVDTLEQHGINSSSNPDESKYHDEVVSDEERANCRVVLKLEDAEYNISNYNNYVLKKVTAIKIASYLDKHALKCEIEELNGFKGNRILNKIEVPKSSVKVKKNEKQVKQEIIANTQLSMFDTKAQIIDEELNTRSITTSNDYKMMKGTNVYRKCVKCGTKIHAGSKTVYYMRVANIDFAPHIENICYSCMNENKAVS